MLCKGLLLLWLMMEFQAPHIQMLDNIALQEG